MSDGFRGAQTASFDPSASCPSRPSRPIATSEHVMPPCRQRRQRLAPGRRVCPLHLAAVNAFSALLAAEQSISPRRSRRPPRPSQSDATVRRRPPRAGPYDHDPSAASSSDGQRLIKEEIEKIKEIPE